MQTIFNFWKTTTGKLAIIGGGGIAGLISIYFICTVCSALFGSDDTTQEVVSKPTQIVVKTLPTEIAEPEPTTIPTESLSTDTPTPLPSTNTPAPTDTPSPIPTNTPTPFIFSYITATEQSGATSYIFEEKIKPKLDLNKEGGIGDIESVNAVLTLLDLPTVSRPVPEQSSITGQRWDRGQYYWEDYPLGALTVERSLCSDENYEKYDCIWKVSIGRE